MEIVESQLSHSIPEEKLYASVVKIVNKSCRVFNKSDLYNSPSRDDMHPKNARRSNVLVRGSLSLARVEVAYGCRPLPEFIKLLPRQ